MQTPIEGERHFKNPYPDADHEQRLFVLDGQLCDPWKSLIFREVLQIHSKINLAYTERQIDTHDYSCYTGISGIGLLEKKLADDLNVNTEQKKLIRSSSKAKIEKAVSKVRKKRLTFLCGDAGPLALGAKMYDQHGEKKKSAACIQNLLKIKYEGIDDYGKPIPDEILYGKAGYLYALLYVKQTIGPETIPNEVVKVVVESIILSGQSARKGRLYFEWHGKEYIGAAHGYIGIYYMLLQAMIICPSSVDSKTCELIKEGINWLLDQRFPSGNIASSIGSDTDRLVHWCHGAPGAVHLFALGYNVFGDSKYLEAAKKCAEVLWERGLLGKGHGLCHGAAGNGYGFLCLYQLTGDTNYLWKAIKFAEWCLDRDNHDCRVPDRPFSLFEGLAGTAYFLADMLEPDKARFPAFQLVSYKDYVYKL